MIPSARDIAVWALSDRGGNVSANLERLLDRGPLPAEERNLAHELALGVVRRRGTLTAVMRAFLSQPDRKLPGALNEIILTALYQLLFLTRVPDFAAVNEAVNQAARYRHRRQSGMVNGLLRTVGRNISPISAGKPPLASDILPVDAESYRQLARPVFSDPVADPAHYLSEAYSLPIDLALRWQRRYGLGKAVELAMQANSRPPLILRTNTLKITPAALVEQLAAEGVEARLHANGVSLVAQGHWNVRELKAFDAGLFQPQDPTASAVALAAAPRSGQSVLDFCAAPGTKTTHLAELMGNAGSILALDVTAEKVEPITSNCRRLGISIVRTALSESAGGIEPQSFDLVLADVPCSNTGVLARRPEARWRFSDDDLGGLVRDQRFLIAAAASFVRPGGRLIYSTCSIEPEECHDLAAAFARHDRGMTLLSEKVTLPSALADPQSWSDGGYYAIFKRG
ncbi:MAG: transcription antitermination factor NusB [Phycisphaerae bacterium]|jgi:16S rRNA (cytosine967-C5)-methyltransferase